MKSKKTVLIVIVIIVAVILLSVASWLIYKKFVKKDEEKNDNPLTDEENPIVTDTNTNTQGRPTDVLAFQKFANSKGYSPKLVEDGIWGGKTASAWAIWKGDFLKPAKLESSVNPYLNPFAGAYPVFNTNPNANPTSNVATGYNAIGKYAYTKGSYTNVRMEPGLGNFFSNTFVGQANSGKIGKIKKYQASGLGINVPGWYQLDLETTLVPSTAGLNHPSGSIPALRKSGYVREDGVVIQNS
jgi:hypothetical protein